MTSLSAEQLKKIEENKLAALLRKQKPCSSVKQSCASYNPNLTSNSVTANRCLPPNKPVQSPVFHETAQRRTSPTITASCRLTSEDRFVVDMNYHGQSIEIFKTITGKMYGVYQFISI